MKRISVVTVVLNDPNGFRRTRTSILSQSSTNWEWIVVDGGSKDETPMLIEEAQDSIKWWVSERDGGIYEGMNKGLLHCNGEFVVFMNAGDIFADLRVLDDIDRVLTANKSADVLLGGTLQDFGVLVTYRPPKTMSWIKHGLPAFHQSTVYRCELFQEHAYDLSYRLLADYEWLAKQATRGISAVYFDRPVSRFMVGGRSYSLNRKKLAELERVKCEILGMPVLLARFDSGLAVMSSYAAVRWSNLWSMLRRAEKNPTERGMGPFGNAVTNETFRWGLS